jgi:hypothetical protein
MLAADLNSQIEALKKSSTVELNIKVDKILQALIAQNVAYYTTALPEAFLVHPSNRGGLMLNHFDVHDKGNTMLKIGVQLSKLVESVAFEISNDPIKRAHQLARNKDLVAASNGMLAPVTGAERFLTVGTSHTMAFCKAVNANCSTKIEELSSTGVLSLSSILASKQVGNENHPFRSMCAEGWKWLIIPSFIEDLHPELPALIQQSLNSSHSVSKQPTEMEVAATIAEYYEKMKLSLDEAVKAAGQSEPKCKHYLATIAHYVKCFAGGEQFPIVRFLESYSSKYGCSLVIGEEFMSAVTFIDMKGDGTTFPFLRAACLAAQLTSPKSSDGISKLLTKSDVEKLKSKDMKKIVELAEKTMAMGWNVILNAAGQGLAAAVCNGCFGKFITRVILHIFGKEKYGREPNGFESLDVINQMFVDEVKSKLATKDNAQVQQAVASSSSKNELQSLQDLLWKSYNHTNAFVV